MKRNALCLLVAVILALSACALGEGEASKLWTLTQTAVFDGASVGFIGEADVLKVKYNNQTHYALYDINGNALTEAKYANIFAARYGFVEVINDDGLYGLVNSQGREVLPCQYGYVYTLSEKWQLGIVFEKTTGEEYDFKSFSNNELYLAARGDVYYNGALVGALTREDSDLNTKYAYGDYLVLRNRNDEYVSYDKDFTARIVASSNEFAQDGPDVIHVPTGQKAFVEGCELTMDNVSNPYRYIRARGVIVNLQGEVISKPERMYYEVGSFTNDFRYAWAIDIDTKLYGVIDINGKELVPCKYMRMTDQTLFDYGYMYVRDGDNIGYYSEAGVLTCPVEFSVKSAKFYSNCFITYEDANGVYSIVAAGAGKLEQQFSGTRVVTDKPLLIVENMDGQAGVIDTNGDLVMPYDDLEMYYVNLSERGTAIVKEGAHNFTYVYSVDPIAAADKADDDSWTCECSSVNTSRFCPECGTERPAPPVTVCPNCSKAAADPANPPKFCPECGAKMNG